MQCSLTILLPTLTYLHTYPWHLFVFNKKNLRWLLLFTFLMMYFIFKTVPNFFRFVYSKNMEIFFEYVYFIFWMHCNQVWIRYRNVLTQLTKMTNPSAIFENILEKYLNVVKYFDHDHWSIVRVYLDRKLTHLSIVKNIWPGWNVLDVVKRFLNY